MSALSAFATRTMGPATGPAVRWIGFLTSLLMSLSLTAQDAVAAKPTLSFDFGRTAECREVTPDASLGLFADEKLIELKLRVSVHLRSGKISDVEEVRIEISDCDRRIRVESFSPNTQLVSNYSENITSTKTTESGHTLGGSLGGEAALPVGDVVAHVLPTVNGSLSERDVLVEKTARHAPQYAVVASGTISREHGVFFKLRSSPQTTLEGTHEFVVRFVVPTKWRADSLRVSCSATGQEKFLWTKQQATWAHAVSPVAVYLAGDLEARVAAEKHVGRRSL